MRPCGNLSTEVPSNMQAPEALKGRLAVFGCLERQRGWKGLSLTPDRPAAYASKNERRVEYNRHGADE